MFRGRDVTSVVGVKTAAMYLYMLQDFAPSTDKPELLDIIAKSQVIVEELRVCMLSLRNPRSQITLNNSNEPRLMCTKSMHYTPMKIHCSYCTIQCYAQCNTRLATPIAPSTHSRPETGDTFPRRAVQCICPQSRKS